MLRKRIMVFAVALWVMLFWAGVAFSQAPEAGLVAYWDFNEGTGTTVHDRSGNGNDGTLIGASWVKVGKGYGLQFGKTNSYVDFEDNPKLKIAGDFSFSAWVEPTADPYPDGTTNWHLFFWEEYQKSGVSCRLDGSNGMLYFRSSQAGTFQHGFSKTMLANRTFYHVVVVKKGEAMTLFIDGKPDVEFSVKDPLSNHLPFTLSWSSQSFSGIMDDVRLYGRAVSVSEVMALYGEGGLGHGKDVSGVGKLRLTPFVYYDEARATVAADFTGVLPLQSGERVIVELRPAGKNEPVEVRERATVPESAKEDFAFELGKLTPGDYGVYVSIRGEGKTRVEESVRFQYPAALPTAPSPATRVVAQLPASPKTPPYAIEVGRGGGFAVRLGDESYPVESTYSYPNGGENRLTANNQADSSGEKGWKVQTEKIGGSTYRVVASGKHYRITREIALQPTRILVKDQIENLTGGDLGLALDNRIDATGKADHEVVVFSSPNPPGFIHGKSQGLGIVPLNDAYQLLQKTYIEGRICGSKIPGFGIPKGASHMLEWAIYPIGTTDYYDLVNAIRRDEGLNGMTVDGCLAITHSGKWQHEPPPEELVRFGGLKYASTGCITHPEDDPGISFEGIEFVRYPKEREALTKYYAEVKKLFPDLKMGFHVAYNIYATNQPEKIFPDSRMIAKSGKHEMYGNFDGYYSKERQEQGWAWYPYYATLTNSFGKELLDSVDVMMDEMGTSMVFGDGLLSGYGPTTGNYPTSSPCTYDTWDGYTVELDHATRTISRKMGNMVLLGEDTLIQYIRKVNAKGGRVWINHMGAIPRAIAKEKAYYDAETNDGDHRCASLHLSPTPHGLANPNNYQTAQKIYDDIRGKLSWGALYVYYWWGGASQLTYPMITTEMYPITLEEIHSGYIKGKERLITLNSGVYGWPGDRQLHAVSLFDGRGHPTSSGFLSTADGTGVRTELALGANQTAVIKKIPLTVLVNKPINVIVGRYDATGIELALNGEGPVRLEVRDGLFPVKPDTAYVVETGQKTTARSDKNGVLALPVVLKGALQLRLKAE